jgi:hypothetical protein
MKSLTNTYKAKVKEFGACLSAVKQDFKNAGELLVSMLDEYPDTFEVLIEQYKLTLPFLEGLERVGRGELDPLLLTESCPAARRIISQDLGIEAQRLAISYPIPVAVEVHGKVDVVNKYWTELSVSETVRVFRDRKIQPPEEQAKEIKQRTLLKSTREQRYYIEDGKVRFNDTYTFWSWKELQEICDKIRPRAEDIEAEVKARQLKK